MCSDSLSKFDAKDLFLNNSCQVKYFIQSSTICVQNKKDDIPKISSHPAQY